MRTLKHFFYFAFLSALIQSAAIANCDDSTSTQRAANATTAQNAFAVDNKKGTVTINGQTHKIELDKNKFDKTKTMSKHRFELLRSTYSQSENQGAVGSRAGCIDSYMDLGICGT